MMDAKISYLEAKLAWVRTVRRGRRLDWIEHALADEQRIARDLADLAEAAETNPHPAEEAVA